jgi:hypothetical protein
VHFWTPPEPGEHGIPSALGIRSADARGAATETSTTNAVASDVAAAIFRPARVEVPFLISSAIRETGNLVDAVGARGRGGVGSAS